MIEPEAVIQVEPDTICPGDGFATTIALDGGQSTPGGGFSVDDPASMSGQLEYRWVFSGPEYRVVAGSHTEAEISITTAGDVPLSVRLTVTDAAGDSASATATLALSSDGADCS